MFINRTDYDKVNKSDFWDDKYINNDTRQCDNAVPATSQ